MKSDLIKKVYGICDKYNVILKGNIKNCGNLLVYYLPTIAKVHCSIMICSCSINSC